jgi:hypothetical protein
MKTLKHIGKKILPTVNFSKQSEEKEQYKKEVEKFCKEHNFCVKWRDERYDVRINNDKQFIVFKRKEPLDWLKQKTIDKLIGD